MQHSTSIRGNAVFLILMAVALFAALIFAISRNSGNFDKTLTSEQSRLIADEIIEYGNGLRIPIDRMMLMDGVSDTNTSGNGILFSATGADAAYGVAGAQPETELFNTSGGKASYQSPPPKSCSAACAYEFTGQYTITGIGSDSKPELAMLVINVDPAVCQKINDILDTGWSSVPADATLTNLARFDGTNYGAATAITLAGVFAGKRSFCYREAAGSQRYIYLNVVRAR